MPAPVFDDRLAWVAPVAVSGPVDAGHARSATMFVPSTPRGRALVSAYHHRFAEPQGGETRPTHFWRDRTADGPRYHIDYVFLEQFVLPAVDP